MADVKGIKGEKILVQIETAPGSGTFAHDCLINLDRSIEFTADGKDTSLPDCDAPSNPAYRRKIIETVSMAVSGSGKLHTLSVEAWNAWLVSGTSKNARVKIDALAADGGGYWTVPLVLTKFSIEGTFKDYAASSVSLENDGAWTWTDAT